MPGGWERRDGGLFMYPHMSIREAVAKMDEPCPCFLFADDGEGQENCECGHALDEHEDNGRGPKACAVHHAEDCPLDHASAPCPVTVTT